MGKTVAYQTKDYKYPDNLWISCYFIIRENGAIFPFITDIAKDSEDEIIELTELYTSTFLKHNRKDEISDNILLLRLKFAELYPLKKKYWEPSTMDVNPFDTADVFAKAMLYWDLYHILVTPSYRDDRKPDQVSFGVGHAFLKNNKEDVDLWLKKVRHPIIQNAKNAAFYDLDLLNCYDLKKGEPIARPWDDII